MRLSYSDNEIITVCGRPAVCSLIGWFKTSHLFISLFGFCLYCGQLTNESAQFLLHSIYEPSVVNFHDFSPIEKKEFGPLTHSAIRVSQ